MADKKITALTALGAGDPDPAVDLLHIIDYSASPVNKKITVANLFSRVDTNISSIGATTFEVGATTVISGLKVNVPNATPAAAAETEVVVNDGSNAFVDFRVESDASAQAIFSDASVNTVYINGDSADVDFHINGDTGVTAFTDASYDALGVGTDVLDGNYTGFQISSNTIGDGDNLVIENTIKNSLWREFSLHNTNNNQVYNNNFISNAETGFLSNANNNIFNLDAPYGGNYYQNEHNSTT